MKNDFTNLLTAVEPKEQEAFHHYLQCFYGNQKAVLTIFGAVVQSLGNGKQPDEIQATYSHNKNALNALSDLKKWLLEFLAFQEIRNDSIESKFLIIEALRKRGLFEAFQQKSKHLVQELDKQKSPNMWHLFWKVRLSHVNYFSTPHDKLHDHQPEMAQLLYDLDSYYMAAKLKYSTELYSRSTILQDTYDIRLLNDILLLLESEMPIHPIVKGFYLPMLKLAKEQSDEAYTQLKTFLIKSTEHEPIERQAVLLYLLNFTVNRLRKGESSFIQEYFCLCEIGLDAALFIVSGNFPTETFLNIVNIGCRLEKYDWSKRFVADWSPYLLPTEKEDTKNVSFARIYFEDKQYNEVITLLRDMSFKNIIFNLNARILLLRAYYEQKHPHYFLLDFSNALYLYTYRNKSIGTDLKIGTLNFVKVFRQLINGKSKKQLFKELDNKKEPVICSDWLKMKIEALKN